jgi:uncharacterized membrane protein
VTRVVQALYFTSLAVWVGGMAVISFVVAPAAFREATSRQEAGRIVGASLRSFGKLEIACGVVALVASLLLRRGGRWERALRPAAAFVMLAVAAIQVGWVYVETAVAREASNAERFASLHRLSVFLMAANLLIGAAQIIASAAKLKAPDGA